MSTTRLATRSPRAFRNGFERRREIDWRRPSWLRGRLLGRRPGLCPGPMAWWPQIHRPGTFRQFCKPPPGPRRTCLPTISRGPRIRWTTWRFFFVQKRRRLARGAMVVAVLHTRGGRPPPERARFVDDGTEFAPNVVRRVFHRLALFVEPVFFPVQLKLAGALYGVS
ncbi:unnamed protein product, partial [Amoebophrya sp. A120]|eukprot:GSA120T00017819001.1